MRSANGTSQEGSPRRGAKAAFFSSPTDVTQRRYEALRAYFVEGRTAAEVAARFGYAPSTVVAMARDFTPEPSSFFLTHRPGPRVAPAKAAARPEVLRLRAAGYSVTDITEALAHSPTPLNRTGVWEICRDEGYERLPTRAAQERPALRERQRRVRAIAWPEGPVTDETSYAGLLLWCPLSWSSTFPEPLPRPACPAPAKCPRCVRFYRCWR